MPRYSYIWNFWKGLFGHYWSYMAFQALDWGLILRWWGKVVASSCLIPLKLGQGGLDLNANAGNAQMLWMVLQAGFARELRKSQKEGRKH